MMSNFEMWEIQTRPPNAVRKALDVNKMIESCNNKLIEQPGHKKALFIRASSFLKKNLYKQSIEDCNQMMLLDSHNAGAYYIRGCAF